LIITPERIPFISYPYEWSFDGYRDAVLTVLQIQEIALNYGMTLKDASAYNIQFVNGSPMLIDTLSFETYREDRPWAAYGQFCRHFLAPLLLMSRVDVRLGRLMQNYIDGVPLDIAAKRGYINFFGGLPRTGSVLEIDTNIIHYKELAVVGTHGSSARHAVLALMLMERDMDVSKYISAIYPLKEINEAVKSAFSGRRLKILIKP